MGGNTYANLIGISNAIGKNNRDVFLAEAYQNEIVSPAENMTYSAKIGLVYLTDYGSTIIA